LQLPEKWADLLDFMADSKGRGSLETGHGTGRHNAVKPFGNSQKGIRKGRLTWVRASDKYPTIK
jgi:hypothetical protein